MSATEVRPESADGYVHRRDVLCRAAAIAARVSGKQMPGGHSFQESHANETVAELRAFLSA